ncbi:MAG: DNA recombination protein RmuC, partial [Clostridia bacterium]|nr:DNA recombination protein RmuC [Clostridia bacterium]
SISQKYIKEDVTTPFAVMYLPSEGLYAEIAKDSALTALLQNEHNVTVCGPTTVTALLNSLQVGFTTLKIQRQSGEIAKMLQQFKKYFKDYTKLVAKVKGQAENVAKNIGDIEEQNKKINKGLANIGGELPQDEEERYIASDVDDIGEE